MLGGAALLHDVFGNSMGGTRIIQRVISAVLEGSITHGFIKISPMEFPNLHHVENGGKRSRESA
jgi:hypothetical protein